VFKATLVLASQEILRISWTLKAHSRIRSRPPFVLIVSHMNSIRNFPKDSFKTLFYYYPLFYACILQLLLRRVFKKTIFWLVIFVYVRKMFITSLKETCSWIVRVLLKGRQHSLFPLSLRSISVTFLLSVQKWCFLFGRLLHRISAR